MILVAGLARSWPYLKRGDTCLRKFLPFQPPALFTMVVYRRIPKVTAPVTFEFCGQKGPLLSSSRYFRTGKKRL